MILKASTAIHGPIVLWLKGHLRRRAAVGANYVVHFPRCADRCFSCRTAIFTTLRFVLESLFRVELLFARRKNELVPTVLTDQCLVFVHVDPLTLNKLVLYTSCRRQTHSACAL